MAYQYGGTKGLLALMRTHNHGRLAALGILVVALDFASGPAVQFPILFVLPVLLSAGYGRANWAFALAIALPAVRLGFDFHWRYLSLNAALLGINAGVRVLVLVLVAVAVNRLVSAREEIRTLKGIIPICASCKKLRDPEGAWNEMESYLRMRSNAEFSHGLCPDCLKHAYAELESNKSKEVWRMGSSSQATSTKSPAKENGEPRPVFAVMGAGHGGLAMAGHLGLMGFEVRLYNRSPQRLTAIRARGGIEVTGDEVDEFGRIALATDDAKEALDGADVVILTGLKASFT